MGATPDRPRPKPTLICHIQISIKLKQSRLKFNISFRGVSRIFERGGPISLGSLKKGGHPNIPMHHWSERPIVRKTNSPMDH